MILKHKLFSRIATCALLVGAAVVTVSAQDATVQASSGLRLRTEANTSSSILTVMPNGATIDVIADAGNGWYQVSYNGSTGYSSSSYIQLSDSAESLTATTLSTTTTTTTETTEEAVDTTTYIQVTSGPLNVRSGPSTSYSKITSLSAGTVVEYTALTDGWYQIATGYVSGDYVKEVDAATVAASSSLGQQIADYAVQFVGCNYVYGGTSPSGFDCSGLVQYVFKNFGISINRTSSSQYSNGTAVSYSQLQAGDVVFFSKSSSGSITHVGLYIGNGQFVHASDYGVGVIISNLTDSYYTTGFVGARRMI